MFSIYDVSRLFLVDSQGSSEIELRKVKCAWGCDGVIFTVCRPCRCEMERGRRGVASQYIHV
jgi:hypothetical protein